MVFLTSVVLSLASVTATPAPPSSAAPAAPAALAVDPGTVQSVMAAEVAPSAACPTFIDRDGRPCGVVRKVELRRIDRDRAIALINGATTKKACKEAPTHAFVVATTRGTKVLPISLRCLTLGDKAFPSQAAASEARDFLRNQGLTTGL